MPRLVRFSETISADIMTAFLKASKTVMPKKNKIIEILVSQEIDEFLFNHLSEIAAKNNIKLQRAKAQTDLFVPMSDDIKSFNVVDSLLTCYKAITRLKTVQTA